MREIHLNETLNGDYRKVDLTDWYFGGCTLNAQFGALPNVTFYACTGSPDFSACPDLSVAYFRNNNFLGILLPAGVTPTQHDLVGAILRTKATTDSNLQADLTETAARIQSNYAQSWLDFYEWMRTRFGKERTQEIASRSFEDVQVWEDRFDEVKK